MIFINVSAEECEECKCSQDDNGSLVCKKEGAYHFKGRDVNLVAVNGFPTSFRRVQIGFVPSDRDTFLAAAQKAGIKLVEPKVVFLIQGEDRVGAVTEVDLPPENDTSYNIVKGGIYGQKKVHTGTNHQ